jgi:hypothetical protein
MKKIKGIIVFVIFAFSLSTSHSQILVTRIDYKGSLSEVPIDSILSQPAHELFSRVVKHLNHIKTPKYFGTEGRSLSVFVLCGNQLIDYENIRDKGNNLVFDMQFKVFKEIKKYFVLKEKSIYYIYIPIEFVVLNSNEKMAMDSIYLDKDNLWKMSEVITIYRIRR